MKIDDRDIACLTLLQEDAEMSLQTISERIHLSPSAASRRIAHLRQSGFVKRVVALLDRVKLGVPTTVFIVIRAPHSEEWTVQFKAAILQIPEIVEAHRLAGNLDYILRVVIPTAEYYDRVYKKLISQISVIEASAYFSMETLKEETPLPVHHLAR